MSERRWQSSLDAEQDPKIKLLSNLVGKVVRGNNESLASQLAGNLCEFTTNFQEDDIEAALEEHATGDFYNRLSLEEKKKVTRILNLSDASIWRYGGREYADGLWDEQGHVAEIPFERRDALVLTGAVGNELIGINRRLDRLASAMEPNVFNRAVLLGGVALVEAGKRTVHDNEIYYGLNHDGFVSETRIGGTIHGDFWTSRQMRFQENPIDPIGDKQVFGPGFEAVTLKAYHSTETRIMSALLWYQVGYQGVDRKRLFQNLVEKAGAITHKSGGAFADFGDDDGRLDAVSLEHLLDRGVKEGEVLANMAVFPQDPQRLILTARQEGLEFASGRQIGRADKFEVDKSFVIPTEEIEDYVITLLGSGYGRTSQSALATVIRTLDGR